MHICRGIAWALVRESADHHHQPLQQGWDFRVNGEEQSDIGQRPNRQQRDFVRMLADRRAEKFNCLMRPVG
jgi:hypothetical protein